MTGIDLQDRILNLVKGQMPSEMRYSPKLVITYQDVDLPHTGALTNLSLARSCA